MMHGKASTVSRLLKYLLAIAMIIAIVPTVAFADTTASGTCGDNLTWTLENGTLTISGTGAMADYEWNGAPWYSLRGDISIVVITSGVTSIGDYAFFDQDGLTSITIPGSITSIGDYAFDSCDCLTSITIPKSVTSIGEVAFSGFSLSSMKVASGNSVYHSSGNCIIKTGSKTLVAGCKASVIPADGSVTSIGTYAFCDCHSLASITIPGSVTSIEKYAFWCCNNLTSITIPDSVTRIGDRAFAYCDSLTYVQIPSSVTSMGYGAFSGCDGLTTAGSIGEGYNIEFGWTKTIPTFALAYSCLTSITIPKSITSIGDWAFADCDSLTSITIPKNVTSIGDCPFQGCDSLTSIKVASGNSVYHSNGNCIIETDSKTLVTGCKSSVIPTDGSVSSIGEGAFAGCELTSITIPKTVTGIGDYAFYQCYNLASITIPKSVTNIGKCAFSYCSRLTSMKVASGNSVYHSSGNCIIKTASKTLVAGCKSSVIPTDGSVTKIGEYAFYECGNLTSITIPKSVTRIGNNAFDGCFRLTSIAIPSSVTSIGDYAFYWCYNLASISIANGVTRIGEGAFVSCESLTKVTIPNSVTSIGKGAFAGCESLASVTIPNSVTYIGAVAFQYCSSLTSVIIPGKVTTINNGTFAYCEKLTSVTIPASVTTIERGAFYDCAKLKNVYYGGSKSNWGKISIDTTKNDKLINAKFTYNASILSITANPKDVTASVGDTAKFTVTATGDDLTYQWQYRTGEKGSWKKSTVSGATTKTVSVKATAAKNGYQYRCKITDGNGKVIYSDVATLYVSNVVITKQPVDTTVSVGGTAKFTVTATGDDLTYQWQYRTDESGSWKNSTVSSATKKTVSVKATEAKNGYQYRCKITDTNGTVIYTNVVTLTVSNVAITKQPGSTTVSAGSTAKLTVTTTGEVLHYQWQYRTSKTGSWKNSSATGYKTNTLSVKGTADRNGYQYRCKITDTNGVVIYTNTVTLTVSNAAITKQPGSTTVSAGSTAKFTVTTTGDNLTYQWQYRTSKSGSWKNSSATGYKTNTLSVKGTASKNGYQYRCKITDANGVVIYTNAVTLTVK